MKTLKTVARGVALLDEKVPGLTTPEVTWGRLAEAADKAAERVGTREYEDRMGEDL